MVLSTAKSLKIEVLSKLWELKCAKLNLREGRTPVLCLHPRHGSPLARLELYRDLKRESFKKHMGKQDKTDKKTKPKQIEALRKQYESLLEEDRKRKERNEYILEKMDKMRSNTTLVHAHHHQPNIQEGASTLLCNRLVPLNATFNTQLYRPIHREATDRFSEQSVPSILKDLYNKFILIPKRLPSIQEPIQKDDSKSDISIDENADWKMKYEILNRLKQEEKEYLGNEATVTPTAQQNDYQNEMLLQDRHQLPEKDISGTVCSKDEDNKNKLSDKNSKTPVYKYPITPDFNTPEVIEKLSSFDIGRPPNKVTTTEETINHQNTPTDSIQINDDPFTKIEGSEKIEHLDDEGINPAHISYPSEILDKPLGDIPTNTEDVQYPIEVINVEEFTPQKDVIVKDGVNVNPEKYGMNQNHFNSDDVDDMSTSPPSKVENTEPSKEPDMVYEESNNELQMVPITQVAYNESSKVPELVENISTDVCGDTAGKGTFETDQQEMFYEEQENEITFDQGAAVGVWDTERNENFQQNDQYFYEGPHEHPESVQINEHEETSTPYDQNYEQQYVTNYEQQEYNEISQPFDQMQAGYEENQEYDASQYEQQQYDQNTPQMYVEQEPTEQYNPESEYDQQIYQQEHYKTVEQVEKQLDDEDGYDTLKQSKEQDQEVLNTQQVAN